METNSEQDANLISNCSQVILLRHAKSTSNTQRQDLRLDPHFDESELISVKVDKSFRDAELSESGFKQCEKVQDFFNDQKVHTVLISPLRRALQSAYHIFKVHPNFNEIRFVLVPKMREIINTSQSFPANINTSIQEFSKLFPNFDTSELDLYPDPLNYYVDDLDDELKEHIKSNLEHKEDDCNQSNAFDLLYQRFMEIYPKNPESNNNLFKRILHVRNKVRELIQKDDFPKDNKIVLVSHSRFFKIYSEYPDSQIIDEQKDLETPESSEKLRNCEFKFDNFNFPFVQS